MIEVQKHFVDADGNHFVASFMSEDEVAAYVPPDGAIEVPERPSVHREWQNGAWVYVAPAPNTPSDFELSMRKLRLGLVRNGFPVDFVPTVIATISDPLERAEAKIWYEETKEGIQWMHPMTQALMAAAAVANPGFTLELAAQMWIEAAAYDA